MVLSKNHIETWTRSIHNRLASKTKPQEKQRQKIPGMQLNVYVIQTTTNILDCMIIQANHLQQLRDYIIRGLPENKDLITQDLQTYWTLRDDMAVIDGVILKTRHVIIVK